MDLFIVLLWVAAFVAAEKNFDSNFPIHILTVTTSHSLQKLNSKYARQAAQATYSVQCVQHTERYSKLMSKLHTQAAPVVEFNRKKRGPLSFCALAASPRFFVCISGFLLRARPTRYLLSYSTSYKRETVDVGQ